jgi:pre-mRNA-splicing factor RBM22/SLT11
MGKHISFQLSTHEPFLDTSKMDPAGRALLKKLSRAKPYSQNKTAVCSFYLKGMCLRGETCPYRHELPNASDFVRKNPRSFRERYYGDGERDHEALQILEEAHSFKVIAPEDLAVTSVQLSGIVDSISEENIQ